MKISNVLNILKPYQIIYTLVISHSYGKSQCLIGKANINHPFSIAMQRNTG
jgi:hypothetical protein